MFGNPIKHKDKKQLSRQIGMEIAAICGEKLLNLEHLHYGYWTRDLKVNLANLRAAQENYVDFLISHIPDNVRSVLDVGCGRGQMAWNLLNAGYNVDCISPSPLLAQQTRDLLGSRSHIFECSYEKFQTRNRYDLLLFSESFQYVQLEEAIRKTDSLLNHCGYLLICDIFKTAVKGKSPTSGGHPLKRFYNLALEYRLELVKNLDITEQTAPNIDLEHHIFNQVIHPIVNGLEQLLDNRYPFLSKVLKWKYRKKIDKIYAKYFGDQRTGENFKKFKSYRLLLYRKTNSE